jgi:hypothetical protein
MGSILSILANLVGLVGVLIMLAILYFGVTITGSIMQRKSRMRGRDKPARNLQILLIFVTMALGFGASCVWQVPDGTPAVLQSLEISAVMIGCASLAVLIVVTAAVLEPSRSRRGPARNLNRAGAVIFARCARAIPWLSVPVALAIGGLISEGDTIFWRGMAILWVFMSLMALRLSLRSAAASLARKDAVTTMRADPRAPVLFLRPFTEEQRAFGISGDGRPLTCEEFLGHAVENGLGPLVALGNPQDRVPPPGAARLYCSDTTWQSALSQLAREAGYILVVAANAQGTEWELNHIRSAGLARKLCLLSPPAAVRVFAVPPSRRQAIARLFKTTLDREQLTVWQSVLSRRPISYEAACQSDWDTYATAVAHCGYALPAVDPGPGSVIGFDADGHGVVLTRGATTPDEYVGAIQRAVMLAEEDAGSGVHESSNSAAMRL